MNTKTKYPNKSSRRARAAALAAVMTLVLAACTTKTADDAPGSSAAPAVFTPPAPPAPVSAPIAQLPEEQISYDIYIMSQCPFGFTGLAELMDITRAFPKRQWNVWFIGRVEGNNLTSMRGPLEVFDEKLWLGVQALYPERYHDFLKLRAESGKPKTEDLIRKMRLDFGKVRSWAEDKGADDELRKHYVRSMNMQIAASPTLYVNNVKFERNFQGGRLVRSECAAANPAPQFCATYPQCAEDNECRAEGKVGRCVKEDGKAAFCEFKDDVAFTLTVLIADSPPDNSEKAQIDMFKERLPAARVNVVKFSSEEGRRLREVHNPAALPYFHLEKNAEATLRFHTVRGMLDAAADGGYQFKDNMTRKNYFPLRPEKTGLIELYADPLMANIDKVIEMLLADSALAKRVVLRPVLTVARGGDQRAAPPPPILDTLRAQEALRWIVMADQFPRNYNAYLKQYAESPGSSYWFNWLRPAGIDREMFMRNIAAAQPKMEEYRQSMAEVSSGEFMMILLNNRTKVAAWTTAQVEHTLKTIVAGGEPELAKGN